MDEDENDYAFVEFLKPNKIVLIQPSLSLEPILYQALRELRNEFDFNPSFRGKSYPNAQQYKFIGGITSQTILARRCVKKILEAFFINGFDFVSSVRALRKSKETLIFRKVTDERRNWTPHFACLVFDTQSGGEYCQVKILDGKENNFLSAVRSSLETYFPKKFHGEKVLWMEREEGLYWKMRFKDSLSVFTCEKKTLLFTQNFLANLYTKGWKIVAHFNGNRNSWSDTLYFTYTESLFRLSDTAFLSNMNFATILVSSQAKIACGLDPRFPMTTDSPYIFTIDEEEKEVVDVLISVQEANKWTVHTFNMFKQWCAFLENLSKFHWDFAHEIRFGARKSVIFGQDSFNATSLFKQFACIVFTPKHLFFVNFPHFREIRAYLTNLSLPFDYVLQFQHGPGINVEKVVWAAARETNSIKFWTFMLHSLNWLYQHGWKLEMTETFNHSSFHTWFFSTTGDPHAPSAPTGFPRYDPLAPPSYEEALGLRP